MKKSYEALGNIGRALGLPLEYAAGLPKIELEGFTTVRIESHKGVLEYGEELVEIAASGANIRVSGTRLSLKCLSAELAVITGRISGINFVFEEGCQ